MVPLFLQFTLPARVLFDLLIILANFPDPLKVLVVIFNHGNVWLFVFILEFVFAFLFAFLFLLIFIFLIFILAFLLPLLHLCLLFELADALSFPYLVVADDSFPHFVIVGVDELPQDFLFLLIFLFELLVENLDLAYLGRELEEGRLQVVFLTAMNPQLLHQLLIESFHVPENDELLGIGQNLHLNQIQIALQLILHAAESL